MLYPSHLNLHKYMNQHWYMYLIHSSLFVGAQCGLDPNFLKEQIKEILVDRFFFFWLPVLLCFDMWKEQVSSLIISLLFLSHCAQSVALAFCQTTEKTSLQPHLSHQRYVNYTFFQSLACTFYCLLKSFIVFSSCLDRMCLYKMIDCLISMEGYYMTILAIIEVCSKYKISLYCQNLTKIPSFVFYVSFEMQEDCSGVQRAIKWYIFRILGI